MMNTIDRSKLIEIIQSTTRSMGSSFLLLIENEKIKDNELRHGELWARTLLERPGWKLRNDNLSAKYGSRAIYHQFRGDVRQFIVDTVYSELGEQALETFENSELTQEDMFHIVDQELQTLPGKFILKPTIYNNEDEIQNAWRERLVNCANTDEILEEKIDLLSKIIEKRVEIDSKHIFLSIDNFNRVDQNDLKLEIVIFYDHLVDRMALKILGFKQRHTFMASLYVSTTTPYRLELMNRGIYDDEHESYLLNRYNDTNKEYAQYDDQKLGIDDLLMGTLSLEFGKKIARLFGRNNDSQLLSKCQITAKKSLELFRLDELLAEKG